MFDVTNCIMGTITFSFVFWQGILPVMHNLLFIKISNKLFRGTKSHAKGEIIHRKTWDYVHFILCISTWWKWICRYPVIIVKCHLKYWHWNRGFVYFICIWWQEYVMKWNCLVVFLSNHMHHYMEKMTRHIKTFSLPASVSQSLSQYFCVNMGVWGGQQTRWSAACAFFLTLPYVLI